MTISDSAENTVLDDIFNAGSGFSLSADPWVSLHTADPGETGANEVTGGSYGRQQVAFGAASSGTLSNSAQVDFTGMPTTTTYAWGVWTASTGGTCLWTGWSSTVHKLFVVTAADLTGNTIQSPGHGFTNDDRVVFEQVAGLGLPTGITAGTIYWVLATTTDTYTISTTQDGTAVDITAEGVGLAHKVIGRATTSGQTLRIAAGDLDIFLD